MNGNVTTTFPSNTPVTIAKLKVVIERDYSLNRDDQYYSLRPTEWPYFEVARSDCSILNDQELLPVNSPLLLRIDDYLSEVELDREATRVIQQIKDAMVEDEGAPAILGSISRFNVNALANITATLLGATSREKLRAYKRTDTGRKKRVGWGKQPYSRWGGTRWAGLLESPRRTFSTGPERLATPTRM